MVLLFYYASGEAEGEYFEIDSKNTVHYPSRE